MKLVICLPNGHVTLSKGSLETGKAFNASLHSVNTLARVLGAEGSRL